MDLNNLLLGGAIRFQEHSSGSCWGAPLPTRDPVSYKLIGSPVQQGGAESMSCGKKGRQEADSLEATCRLRADSVRALPASAGQTSVPRSLLLQRQRSSLSFKWGFAPMLLTMLCCLKSQSITGWQVLCETLSCANKWKVCGTTSQGLGNNELI